MLELDAVVSSINFMGALSNFVDMYDRVSNYLSPSDLNYSVLCFVYIYIYIYILCKNFAYLYYILQGSRQNKKL